MDRDELFMKRALALAARGRGSVSPNPMVGALVVRGNRVLAEGYHHRAGQAHAEIIALAKAGKKARGAELFLNLEPCTHTGRTPPCAPAVISSGVKRVVVGMVDPNPKVSGAGIKAMKQAGIEVKVGVMEDECRQLNEFFAHWVTTGEPFCILKAAMSLDGKIATRIGHSQWITSTESRRDVHRMRAEVDAILIGAGTIRTDNPSLTVREVKSNRQPKPVILSGDLDLPIKARVFDHPAGPVVITSSHAPALRRKKFEKRGLEIITMPEKNGLITWKPLLRELGKRNLTSVLIEGGGQVFGSALADRVVKKAVFYIAPIIIGGDASPGVFRGKGVTLLEDAPRLNDLSIKQIGPDIKITGYF